MNNPQAAAARIRTYLRLLPTAQTLGGEIAYSEHFRSEDWPRACYAPTRGDVEALLAAVPAGLVAVPPTSTDRDRIIQALYEARRPGLGGMTEADAVAYMADAVLGVLPPSADGAAMERVRAVLETEAVLGRSALEYRGLITSALMGDDAPAGSEDTTTTRADVLREAADDLAEFIALHGPTSRTVAGWRGAVGFLRRMAAETQPSEPQSEPPPVCEGFRWIGQSFATCDRCGQPAWDHVGEEIPVDGAGPFDGEWTVRPWNPGEADRIRAKWDRPAAASAGVQTDEEISRG